MPTITTSLNANSSATTTGGYFSTWKKLFCSICVTMVVVSGRPRSNRQQPNCVDLINIRYNIQNSSTALLSAPNNSHKRACRDTKDDELYVQPGENYFTCAAKHYGSTCSTLLDQFIDEEVERRVVKDPIIHNRPLIVHTHNAATQANNVCDKEVWGYNAYDNCFYNFGVLEQNVTCGSSESPYKGCDLTQYDLNKTQENNLNHVHDEL